MDGSTRTDIPTPESADAKEVFAFFGLAAYHAQVLEQEIFLFAVFLQLSKSANRSPALVEALLQRLDAKTFGQLLNKGRTLTDVPEAVERLLNDALKAGTCLTNTTNTSAVTSSGQSLPR
jgi:hypothetical protein